MHSYVACVASCADSKGLIARALRGTVRTAGAPPPASMRGSRSHPGVNSRTGERSAAGGKVAIAAARGAHAPPPPRSGGGVAAGRRIPTHLLYMVSTHHSHTNTAVMQAFVWLNSRLMVTRPRSPFLTRDFSKLRMLQTPIKSKEISTRLQEIPPVHPRDLYSHLLAS